ncbi:MAG TPA: anaerobic ribonucleoside-triphosphate reductase [Caldisericia bacterium]|nr:anaerobic ribonucleoside-triphosphate reductase [Caldisericia bacterium]
MFGDNATTVRTLRNIKKALDKNLKEKYKIENEEISNKIMAIHGLDKKRFDFVNSIETIINDNLNDVSIDANSNKNEKTIEAIHQEATASVKKAVGFDYLYRQMKDLYGKEEAIRLSGEMYDLSLGLSDSTNILKPYSYYAHTPILVKINEEIQYITLKKLFEMFEFKKIVIDDGEFIDSINIEKDFMIQKSLINGKYAKSSTRVNRELKQSIKEIINIKVWDSKNGWVNINRIIRHKNEKDLILYQVENGNYALVTEDHPIYMMNGLEKIAKDLSIGDEVLRDEDMSLPKIDETIIVPKELAYFSGFALGDGNIQSYDIDMQKSDRKRKLGISFLRGGNLISIYQKNIENSYIKKVCENLFENVNFWKFNDKSDRQLCFTSHDYNYICSVLFGYNNKENSFTKHLPINFMSWTKESKESFIAGLIDADGTISNNEHNLVSIRLMSLATINGLYDCLNSLDGIEGVRNRIDGKEIDNCMYEVSFKITKKSNLIYLSEKIKNIYSLFSEEFCYNQNMSRKSKEMKISKIIRFNIKDIQDTRFLKKELEYVYDISTDTGRFYANGMVQHNCWAMDTSKIVTMGREFGQLYSKPAKRVSSYISALCETVHQMSSHLAGAIAISTFFLDISHLSLYKEKYDLRELKTNKEYRKKIENEMQQFVHSVNHLSRNGVESPFTNISILDRIKLRNIITDMSWYFPFDELPIEHPEFETEEEKKEFYTNYVIDYIEEVQNIFLDFFDKGDPLKGGAPYRFPVVTICISKKKWGDREIIEDLNFLKNVCKRDIFRYNIFVSEGSKVASCCRLLSNTEMLQFASQSNSFGAGGSVSLGSHRVCTINFPRIVMEANSREEFYKILESRIESASKILKAHKELILNLNKRGLQPFIKLGWINMNRMFSTFGIIGIYEASKLFKDKFGNGEDIESNMLIFLNNKVNELNKVDSSSSISYNIEQIPGESFAIRLAKADKIIYGEDKIPYQLYSNQFIPLWESATLWEKMIQDGKYQRLITGGGIVHAQIGEKVTSKQSEKIIKFAVNCGCEHFALNAVYSECEDGHVSFGKLDICPICSKKIIERYTRIVGFFTPISSWQDIRREWEFPRRTFVEIEKD